MKDKGNKADDVWSCGMFRTERKKKTEKNFTGIERTATVASSYFLG